MEKVEKGKTFSVLHAIKDQNTQTPEYIFDFIKGVSDAGVVRDTFAKHFNLPLTDPGDTQNPQNIVLDFVPSNFEVDVLDPELNWFDHYTSLKNKHLDTYPEDSDPKRMFLIYINPPFSKIDKFISKADAELRRVPEGEIMPILFLCPLRAETIGFHSMVLSDTSRCFLVSPINGSVKFVGHKNGLYGSIAFLFFGNGPIDRRDFECKYTTPERRVYSQKRLASLARLEEGKKKKKKKDKKEKKEDK
jgi:hypothetical protein